MSLYITARYNGLPCNPLLVIELARDIFYSEWQSIASFDRGGSSPLCCARDAGRWEVRKRSGTGTDVDSMYYVGLGVGTEVDWRD